MSARRAGCANTSAAQREVSPATGGLRLRAGLGFRGFRDFSGALGVGGFRDFSGALGVGGFRDFSGALGVEGVTGFIEFRGISEIQSCVYIYIHMYVCVCCVCVCVRLFVLAAVPSQIGRLRVSVLYKEDWAVRALGSLGSLGLMLT